MKDEDLNQLFNDRPKPSEAAKSAAKRAAVAEFRAVQEEIKQEQKKELSLFQVLSLLWRPNKGEQSQTEDTQMKDFPKPWLLSGMATVTAAVLAVLIIGTETHLNRVPQPSQGPLDAQEQLAGLEASVAEDKAARSSEPGRKPASLDQADALSVAPAPMELEEAEPMAEVLPELATQPVSAPLASGAPMAQPRKKELELRKAQSDVARRSVLVQLPDDLINLPEQEHRDQFEHFEINPVKLVSEEPVSTFSADVDTASYSFVRRSLNGGRLPPKDAVRVEEMLNYFDYDYPSPDSRKQPFEPHITVIDSPWAKNNKLVHIGIKGYELQAKQKPRSHLTFLLDVSGSMSSADKLPLVKQSMNLLLSTLDEDDTVAIAVYAGAAGTVLEPTKVKEKQKILDAMNRLQAGGSTAGAQGIQLAYALAESTFDENAVNRIILATDGDFNVGITNREELTGFVERKRDQGIYLTILGFGRGNYQDQLMQSLAQNGNGAAAYIDTLSEAQKVLVDEASSTLFPIAKDVKLQVEFNPAAVSEYRLIGYETRALNREDFNNDKVDAGELGAGHSVTAIYEISPVGSDANMVDELRYGKKDLLEEETPLEYGYLKIRYKLPDETSSQLIEKAIPYFNENAASLVTEAQFATAVVGFAQLLKEPKYLGEWGFDEALSLAKEGKGRDEFGYRSEFIQLIRKAQIANKM
jgi:Ca-activated chloride channel family protein